MNSQILIVDLVRNWHTVGNNSRFASKDLEHFTLSLVSQPVEYDGTEDFSVIVLWGDVETKPKAEGERNPVHDLIHEVVKKFAIGVGCRTSQVNHDNRTTKVKLKAEEAKNVVEFEWLEINLADHKRLE
jgi:hypothetical protein